MAGTRSLAAGILAAALALASIPSAVADTPCDALRNKARMLAVQHPEATEDMGDGRFLAAVLAPQPEPQGRGIDCDGLRTWLKEAGLDSRIVDDLENDEFLCYTWLTLYDHRKDGGFVALAGTQGSGHEPVVQILDVFDGGIRVGWGYVGSVWPESFDVFYVGGRAYPAMLTPKLRDTDLSYRVDLISVEKGIDAPFCGLSITYQPQFLVGDWFGPKGENDVDPELRRAIEPIVSALAAGHDVQQLVMPWLDHPRGRSPYDNAIGGYPDQPIDGMRYPNTGDHVYGLPWYVPFLTGKYDDEYYKGAYGSIKGPDPIPLYINGRRLLLLFGNAWTPGSPPPEAGFGVYEYNDQKRDFDGVSGGIMERRGRNPRIE